MKPSAQSFLRFPLNLVFDSPANVRVLRVLARHGGTLSASTLADAAKLTKPSVLSALGQLADAGVVEALGSGRQRLYRFREAGGIGPALSAVFAAEQQAYHDVVEMVRAAAARAGVQAAWLYGSVARGDDRPGSDIDVAIIAADGRTADVAATLRDMLSGSAQRVGSEVSVIGVGAADIARLEREGDPWWRDLRRDAIVVLGPPPEAFVGRAPGERRRVR